MFRKIRELAVVPRFLTRLGSGVLLLALVLVAAPWAAARWNWASSASLTTKLLLAAVVLVAVGLAALHRRDDIRERTVDDANDDHDVVRGPQTLTPWFVSAVVLAILGTGAVVLVVLVNWVRGISGVVGRDHVVSLLDIAKIVTGLVAGGGAVFVLYLTARRQRTSEADLRLRHRAQVHVELNARESWKDAWHRRINDQYGQAIEHLGSDSAAARLAGMLTLEHLAQDNADRRQTVVDVLCGYLRMPYTPLSPDAQSSSSSKSNEVTDAVLQERQVRDTAQRIIIRHLTYNYHPESPGEPVDEFWESIDLDLAGATLIDFKFVDCRVGSVTFERANFLWRAAFDNTVFTRSARFDEATFNRGVVFTDTTFEGLARFDRAIFRGSANFARAEFRRQFQAGGSVEAQFSHARFEHAADFSEASFKTVPSFSGTMFAQKPIFAQTIFQSGVPAEIVSYLDETP